MVSLISFSWQMVANGERGPSASSTATESVDIPSASSSHGAGGGREGLAIEKPSILKMGTHKLHLHHYQHLPPQQGGGSGRWEGALGNNTSPTSASSRQHGCCVFEGGASTTSLTAAASASASNGSKRPRPKSVSSSSSSSTSAYMGAAAVTIMDEEIPPQDFLHSILRERGYETAPIVASQQPFFQPPTQQQVHDYDLALVTAVKAGDLEGIKRFASLGRRMDACNKHGESIVHISCRRGRTDILRFLLQHGARVHMCDDLGRTPLHDACWAKHPVFECVSALMERDPTLIRVVDCRGATPLAYIRREHWSVWRQFFDAKKEEYWAHLPTSSSTSCKEEGRDESPTLLTRLPRELSFSSCIGSDGLMSVAASPEQQEVVDDMAADDLIIGADNGEVVVEMEAEACGLVIADSQQHQPQHQQAIDAAAAAAEEEKAEEERQHWHSSQSRRKQRRMQGAIPSSSSSVSSVTSSASSMTSSSSSSSLSSTAAGEL